MTLRTAIAILWLIGAATIGVALLWAAYQLVATLFSEGFAIVCLTLLLLVVGVTWIVALTELPVDTSYTKGREDRTP